jgi:hypothetical protein
MVTGVITTIFPRIHARTYYAHPRARVMSFSTGRATSQYVPAYTYKGLSAMPRVHGFQSDVDGDFTFCKGRQRDPFNGKSVRKTQTYFPDWTRHRGTVTVTVEAQLPESHVSIFDKSMEMTLGTMISYSSTSTNNCPNSRRAAKQTKAQTFTFQTAEHALHDDLRAGGASDTARALESADLDGGPGAVGKLDTGAALSGGRSIRAHGGAGAEGRDDAAGERAADGASSSGGLHFALFRNRNEHISRLAFHFERGCCSFGSRTHACHLVRRRRVMRRWEVECCSIHLSSVGGETDHTLCARCSNNPRVRKAK